MIVWKTIQSNWNSLLWNIAAIDSFCVPACASLSLRWNAKSKNTGLDYNIWQDYFHSLSPLSCNRVRSCAAGWHSGCNVPLTSFDVDVLFQAEKENVWECYRTRLASVYLKVFYELICFFSPSNMNGCWLKQTETLSWPLFRLSAPLFVSEEVIRHY